MNMRSNYGPCHGRRQRGCSLETKSVLLSWVNHGHCRKFASILRRFRVRTADPFVFSVLGWVPGIITMVIAGILFWITSMTMWKFIMKHPQIKDICDFGFYAFGKSRIAYGFSGFMLLANNILLVGFHILTGAKILNTLSDHSLCTVVFSVIMMLMGIVMSIPRTLRHVSFMSMFSGE